jgi:hypothetical protein
MLQPCYRDVACYVLLGAPPWRAADTLPAETLQAASLREGLVLPMMFLPSMLQSRDQNFTATGSRSASVVSKN